eukprot:6929_1
MSDSSSKYLFGQDPMIQSATLPPYLSYTRKLVSLDNWRHSRQNLSNTIQQQAPAQEKELTYVECIDIVRGYSKMMGHRRHVPVEIMQLILFYFYETFKFNVHNHGKGFRFINNQTVEKISSETATCIFGEQITSKKCKGFDLYIQWTRCVDSFFMGYITSSLENSIKDSTQFLGHGSNKRHSVGIEVYKEYNNFTLSDANHHYHMLRYRARDNFKEGDVFRLSFNFQRKELVIYHNGFTADSLVLEHKQLTPAISLRHQEKIEIIKCGLWLHS